MNLCVTKARSFARESAAPLQKLHETKRRNYIIYQSTDNLHLAYFYWDRLSLITDRLRRGGEYYAYTHTHTYTYTHTHATQLEDDTIRFVILISFNVVNIFVFSVSHKWHNWVLRFYCVILRDDGEKEWTVFFLVCQIELRERSVEAEDAVSSWSSICSCYFIDVHIVPNLHELKIIFFLWWCSTFSSLCFFHSPDFHNSCNMENESRSVGDFAAQSNRSV